MSDNELDVVADTINGLSGAESLAETPFSGLYHEARTSTPDTAGTHGYSGISVQVRVKNGTLETSDPVKTRQGEHLRGTDAWDGIISLPVKPFMRVSEARQQIIWQLKELKQTYAARVAGCNA